MRKELRKGPEVLRVMALQLLLLILVSLGTLLHAEHAYAIQSGITYHGRILKPDGTPLESTNVKFKLQIRTPGTENCLLYEEQQTRNLAGSGGVFSITLGDGSGVRGAADEYAPGQSLTLDRAFQNKAGFPSTLKSCDSGSAYAPNIADGRRFQVEFRDASMTAWEKLPAAAINYVPFALESKSLSGFQPQHLLRFDDAAALLNTTPLSVTDYTDLVALIAGTSTKYTRAGQLNGVALPTLSNGQSLQWNSGSWTAVTPLTSETDPNVQAFAKTALPNCAAGEVLQSNGTGFLCVTDNTSGTPVDATTTAKGIVQISPTGGISVSAGVISLPDQGGITAGNSYTKVTVDAKGRITAGAALAESDLPSITNAWSGTIDGSKIDGTIGGATAISTSGAITTGGAVGARTFNLFDADTNKISFVAPALSADYSLTWPAALPGVSGQILSVNTSGQLSWIAPSSGSVTSVTAAAPLSSTGGATPQISISQANSTTNGYLSNTDWSTFNNKLGTTLANGSMWLGNGSNVATAVAPSGDLSVTNAGAFTVTHLQGRSVATTTPVTGQVLRYNSSNAWEAANFSVSDLRKSDGTSQFASASCSVGQTLNWSSLTDTFTCVNISIANTQVTGLGTASTKNFGTAAGNLVELDAGAKIPASLLPAGAASQWVTTGSDIYYNTGNVGIGTTNPGNALEVNGTAQAVAMTATDSFRISPTGGIFYVRDNMGVVANSGMSIGFSSTTSNANTGPDTRVWRDAAGIVGQRNGAAAQAYRLYNTYTDASNYERGVLDWQTTANVFRIGTEAVGTGTVRNIALIGGNVGIGTTNPTLSLDVAGPIRSTTLNGSVQESLVLTNTHVGAGSGASILFGNAVKLAQIANVVESTTTDSSLTFSTRRTSGNPTEKMRITAAGNVGIGTTAPTSELDVVGTVKARQGTFQINGGQVLSATGNTNGSSPYVFQVSNSTATADDQYLMRAFSNSVERFHIANTGRTYFADSVGIGTTTPGAPLDVKGEIRLSGATSGYTGFRPAAAAGSTVWQLPSTDGSSGQALVTNGSGVLTWQTPSGTGVSTLTVNAPITNGGTATAPNLSIAPASGSTNGYLSSSDWTTFNNKQGTGLTSANIWVGNGSNTAAAVAPSGDVSMTNAGAFTVTRLQSRTVASTLPVTSQVLRYNTATTSWEPQYVNFGDLKKSDGTSQFPGTPCTSAQTLTWSSLTDTFVCSSISIASSQVTGLGTAAAKNFGTAAGNLVELDAGAKIPASLLPSGAASQWTTSGSNISYTAGNVGVGTASPARSLHVSGGFRLEPAALPSSPAAGDLAVDSGDANQFKYHDGAGWRTLSTFAQYNWDNRTYSAASTGVDGQPDVATNAMYNTNALDGTAAVLRVGVRNTAGNYQNAYIGSVSNTAGYAPSVVIGQRTSSTNYAERLRIDSSGRVGIGTSAPGAPLQVQSSATMAFPATSGSTQAGSVLRLSNAASNGVLDFGNYGSNGMWLQSTNATSLNSNYPLLLNPNGGNIGIGTTSPTTDLSFGNPGASLGRVIGIESGAAGDAGAYLTVRASNSGTGTNLSGGSLYLSSGASTGTGGSTMYFQTATPGSSGTTANSASTKMTLTGTGRLGVGTATPDTILHVAGTSGNTLKIVDGNQAAGKVLVSDANGVATWTTLAPGGVTSLTVNAPITNGGTSSAPNLSIAQANGSTNGYLSSTDWSTFNNKLGTTLTGGSIWVGNGSNVATAVAPAGDVTMTNAGSFTVTKLQGRTVASTTPVTGQYLRYNTTNTSWEPQYFNVTDLRKSDGTSQFASASCTAGQTLNWSSLTDTFTCTNISIANTQVTGLGTASTKNFGTAAGNLVELDAGAKIPASLLPTGAASKWTATGSDIYYSTGNVGVGTATPGQPLDVVGIARAGRFVANGTGNNPGLPQITFNSDSDTGMYLIANDILGFSTGGAERLRINASGNVGIGTASPNSKLQVEGNITARMTSSYPRIEAISSQAAGYAPPMIAMSRTNTGGAATPDNQGLGEIRFEGISTSSAYVSPASIIATGGVNTANGIPGQLVFSTDPADGSGIQARMTILPNGAVAVGPSNSTGYMFQVNAALSGPGSYFNTALYDTAAMAQNIGGGLAFGGEYNSTTHATAIFGGIRGGKETATNNSYGGYVSLYTRPAGSNPVERIRIDSNGNVGIGTTVPEHLLHLSKSGYAQALLESINDHAEFDMAAYGTGKQSMFFLTAARGTEASPTYLQAGDSVGYIGAAAAQGGRQSGRIAFYASDNWTSTSTPGILTFSTTPSAATVPYERMRIDENGNVGIGTSSPTIPLHVESSQAVTYMTLRSTAAMAANNGGTILLSGRYDASNNADFASVSGVKENGTSGSDGGALTFSTNTAGATYLQEHMRITAAGRIGMGTASPNYKLDVAGDINASGSVRAAGVALTSDIRYKRDIQTIDDALEKLLNLRGVSYNWRTEAFPHKHFNNRQQIGVIAQEVEAQFPEAVDTNHEGFKSVNYPALVAPIIEALRTLHERIVGVESKQTSQAREIASKADRAEVDALKEENSALKAKAAKIEKENELIKAYLCAKDPTAPLCR